MKVLAIIPARGGSKAIPRKNLVEFGGKPLIAWSIEHARDCRHIDRTVVSTDDAVEIAEISRLWGAEIVERPPHLSTDTAGSEAALVHVLDTLEKDGYVPDLVVFLQATSPLRGPGDLNEAIEALLAEGADSLVSVGPFHGFVWEIAQGKGAANDLRPLKTGPGGRT